MNIQCIGAGGIGSFYAAHIDRLISSNQISGNIHKFHFYDFDKVETKNILYQNFEPSDVDSYKTDALCYRYLNIEFKNIKVEFEHFKDFDLIILCADNNIIRREVYENWIKNKIPFIDSRANGKTVGIFSSDTENYLSTIDESTGSSSCQNPFQIERGEVEYGNVVIASCLAQVTLDYIRNNKLPNDFIHMF